MYKFDIGEMLMKEEKKNYDKQTIASLKSAKAILEISINNEMLREMSFIIVENMNPTIVSALDLKKEL